MAPHLLPCIPLGKDPRKIDGGIYWVGNAMPNNTLGCYNYNVFCGYGNDNEPTISVAETCCAGTNASGTNCGKYTANSSACSQLMIDYLTTKIRSGNPTDTVTAIQIGNEYLSRVTNLPVRDAFVTQMWRAFWESRQSPNGYVNDYLTWSNLSDADSVNLNALIAWCGSSTNGKACSAYVTQAGTGICNGPSASSPLVRSDLDPYSSETSTTADQRAQLRGMCGCNLTTKISTNYPNPELGIQCDPICAIPSTIQNVETGRCTSPVCVIDNFTVDLAKSSSISGGVTINQICTGGKQCNSSCYIDYDQLNAIRSKISGGLNINQTCGGCYDAITLKQVDCNTGEACTGPDCGGCVGGQPGSGGGTEPTSSTTTFYYWLKARPGLIFGLFILGVLLVCLLTWLIIRKERHRK